MKNTLNTREITTPRNYLKTSLHETKGIHSKSLKRQKPSQTISEIELSILKIPKAPLRKYIIETIIGLIKGK